MRGIHSIHLKLRWEKSESYEFTDDALVDEEGDGEAEYADESEVATTPAEILFQSFSGWAPFLYEPVLVCLHSSSHFLFFFFFFSLWCVFLAMLSLSHIHSLVCALFSFTFSLSFPLFGCGYAYPLFGLAFLLFFFKFFFSPCTSKVYVFLLAKWLWFAISIASSSVTSS